MKTTIGIYENRINFRGDCIVFSEGRDSSIDKIVLESLLSDLPKPPKICPLGTSFHLKSASDAFKYSVSDDLNNYTQNWCFIIDRDHHTYDDINKEWNNLKKGKAPKLLYWRKKEIENYLLDPSLLKKSDLLIDYTIEDLKHKIVKYANRYLYMFAVNQVIIQVREELKGCWIKLYKDFGQFKNFEDSIKQLTKNKCFEKHLNRHGELITIESLKQNVIKALIDYTGNEQYCIEWGKGTWQDLMPGHELLYGVLSELKIDPHKIITEILVEKNNLPEDFKILRNYFEKYTQ